MVETIRRKEQTYCVAINPEKVCFAHGDENFRKIVQKASFHICDGAGTAAAVRILWGVKIPRITGIGLFLRMVATAEKEDLRVFLLGARPEVIQRTRLTLCERHPRLRVAGCLHGYFQEDQSQSVVEKINAARADMLFVGLGSPKQERWIGQHRSRLDTPFCMGVGGSFDVLSGCAKRAPRVFQSTGTEWLYRLAKEPWRWRRQTALVGFALSVLRQRVWSRQWATRVADAGAVRHDVVGDRPIPADIPSGEEQSLAGAVSTESR